jgi:hypothetical protein
MWAKSRSTRALLVLGATAAATLISAALIGPHAALAACLGFLAIGTIATIPGDLGPGEYDVFGLGVFAAVVALGLVAMLYDGKPKVSYTSDMDVCGDDGCPDQR